jgi:hypothetical protein
MPDTRFVTGPAMALGSPSLIQTQAGWDAAMSWASPLNLAGVNRFAMRSGLSASHGSKAAKQFWANAGPGAGISRVMAKEKFRSGSKSHLRSKDALDSMVLKTTLDLKFGACPPSR